MSAITTVSSAVNDKVWVQIEGYDAMYLVYELHTTIIDDLKQMVFKGDRYKYQAFFRQQYLLPYGRVPNETSGEEPIIFKLIKNRRMTQTNDDVTGMGISMGTSDETRTIYSNRQIASKLNKCMNKSQSNCT
ncbi:unnamed protein product [Rotaria sp. Silwood1]|nr:unnamed protein product [Rotaria sp. Silwood1]